MICLLTFINHFILFLLCQIDDLDVEKCRQGRLEYLGLLSFMIIAAPMTLILLNDKLGDAMIDSAIPSIFSGFFIVGSVLYDVSLAALLLPICLFLGVVIYYIFVYRPSRAAYCRRADELRKLSAQGVAYTKSTKRGRKAYRKYSALKSFDHYFGRVVSITIHSVQHAVTYFSSYHIAVSKSKAYSHKRQWRDMNAPNTFQGAIPALGEHEYIFLESNVSHRHRGGVFLPPSKISNMMTSTTQWKKAYDEQMKNKKFIGSLRDIGARVITRRQEANKNLREVKTLIYFEPEEVLDMLRVNLIKADSTTSCEVLNRHCEVPLVELIEDFKEALHYFYPDGIEMTADEKEEAAELLVDWTDTQNLRIAVQIECGTLIEVQMLDFLLFDKWFSDTFMTVMYQIKDERLLNHTLRYVPSVKKRVLRTAASLIEGFTQKEPEHPEGHVKKMKALSMVTFEELSAPVDFPRLTSPRRNFASPSDEEAKGWHAMSSSSEETSSI